MKRPAWGDAGGGHQTTEGYHDGFMTTPQYLEPPQGTRGLEGARAFDRDVVADGNDAFVRPIIPGEFSGYDRAAQYAVACAIAAVSRDGLEPVVLVLSVVDGVRTRQIVGLAPPMRGVASA